MYARMHTYSVQIQKKIIHINVHTHVFKGTNIYIYIHLVHIFPYVNNLILVPDIFLVGSSVLQNSMDFHAVQRAIHSFSPC